jgi:hypothetical protein
MISADQSRRAWFVVRALSIAISAWGIQLLVRSLSRRDWSPAGLGFDVGICAACLLVAYQGWFCRTTGSLRRLCFMGALVLMISGLDATDDAFKVITGHDPHNSPSALPNSQNAIIFDVCEIVSSLGAIASYHIAVSGLLPRLGLVDRRSPSQRIWSAKNSFALVGWITFMIAISMSGPFIQNHPIRNGPGLADTIAILAPLVLSIAVYRIGMFFAKRRIFGAKMQTLNEPIPVATVS